LIALEYTDELRQSIESFKYHGASHLEGQFIPFLKKTWNTFEIPREHVIITSIPMHLFSRITHPLDHGKLLSKKLALELGVPYAPLLTKTRHTKRQATLDRAERMKNIAQAFRCNKIDKKQLSEKIIVIVDDVISTSSTANAAAKALKEAGAKTVYGLFLATGK
jgi:predicted amidophosphoribosyltransferase